MVSGLDTEGRTVSPRKQVDIGKGSARMWPEETYFKSHERNEVALSGERQLTVEREREARVGDV